MSRARMLLGTLIAAAMAASSARLSHQMGVAEARQALQAASASLPLDTWAGEYMKRAAPRVNIWGVMGGAGAGCSCSGWGLVLGTDGESAMMPVEPARGGEAAVTGNRHRAQQRA
jgi:hypothetical protein